MADTKLFTEQSLSSGNLNPQNSHSAKILLVFQELQKIDGEFPLQYAICLLEIASNPNISPTQLSELTGIALPTISRITGALSDNRQKGKPFGLIEVTISKSSRRSKNLALTPKGQSLIDRINLILESD